LLIVSSISFGVSKKYEAYSMDVKKLAKKGEAFTSNKDRNILSSISLDDVLIKDYQTLNSNENLERLVEIVSQTNQRHFAVVDANQTLVGILDFDRVRNIVFNNFQVKYSKISEIMKPIEDVIYYENSIYIMLEKLDLSGQNFLPIIKDKKYYGFVSKLKILEHYRSLLKSMRVE
jgi:CIC family chloride channel protein